MLYDYLTDTYYGFRGVLLYIACLPLFFLAFTGLVWLIYPLFAAAASPDRLVNSAIWGACILPVWAFAIDGPRPHWLQTFLLIIRMTALTLLIWFVAQALIVVILAFGFVYTFTDAGFIQSFYYLTTSNGIALTSLLAIVVYGLSFLGVLPQPHHYADCLPQLYR